MLKKFFSFAISLSLLLTLGTVASAAQFTEVTPNEALPSREELFDMGREYFPEYSNILNGAVPANTQSTPSIGGNEIVCVETRAISDNEHLTYQQYASGAASLIFNKSWATDSTTTSGNTKTYTGNLVVGCNWSQETFALTGFQYKIVTNGYDSIANKGSTAISSCKCNEYSYKSTENSSSNAYLKYNVVFQPIPTLWDAGYSPVSGLVTLSVGKDSFSYSVQ